MDYSVLIGRKVTHGGFRGFGEGTIVALEGVIISVDFDGEVRKFGIRVFNQHFSFADDDTRKIIEAAVEEINEAERVAAEERAAEAETARSKEAAAARREKLVRGFDESYHAVFLRTDEVYDYRQVEADYGIHIFPFGRGINPTNDSVVLISSINKTGGNYVYHDKWDSNGDYIYSGEGSIGDQAMTRGNLEIKDAETNGKAIHLFVKFSAQEYYYQGIFKLVDYTYEDDLDEDGNIRKEYKFRLRKV